MPFGGETGPMGASPITGRAAGCCAGFGVPGHMNPGPARRCGRGDGRGWRHCFWATGLPGWMRRGWGWAPVPPAGSMPAATEKQWLENQAQALQARRDAIRKRLSELDAEAK